MLRCEKGKGSEVQSEVGEVMQEMQREVSNGNHKQPASQAVMTTHKCCAPSHVSVRLCLWHKSRVTLRRSSCERSRESRR